MMKKFNVLLLVCLLCAMLFMTGCGGQTLSDDFDQTTVEDAARNVVTLINNQDSEAIFALCTQRLRDALTEDILQEMYDISELGGAFVEIEKIALTEATEDNIKYAVAAVTVNHEEQTLVYTMSFNTDMQLGGLYCKISQ